MPSFDRIRHRRHDASVFLYADLIELNGGRSPPRPARSPQGDACIRAVAQAQWHAPSEEGRPAFISRFLGLEIRSTGCALAAIVPSMPTSLRFQQCLQVLDHHLKLLKTQRARQCNSEAVYRPCL
jgi:hypothetical protein